jgi:hypothetical protein
VPASWSTAAVIVGASLFGLLLWLIKVMDWSFLSGDGAAATARVRAGPGFMAQGGRRAAVARHGCGWVRPGTQRRERAGWVRAARPRHRLERVQGRGPCPSCASAERTFGSTQGPGVFLSNAGAPAPRH